MDLANCTRITSDYSGVGGWVGRSVGWSISLPPSFDLMDAWIAMITKRVGVSYYYHHYCSWPVPQRDESQLVSSSYAWLSFFPSCLHHHHRACSSLFYRLCIDPLRLLYFPIPHTSSQRQNFSMHTWNHQVQ